MLHGPTRKPTTTRHRGWTDTEDERMLSTAFLQTGSVSPCVLSQYGIYRDRLKSWYVVW